MWLLIPVVIVGFISLENIPSALIELQFWDDEKVWDWELTIVLEIER